MVSMLIHRYYSPWQVCAQLLQGKSLFRALFNVSIQRFTISGRILDLGAKDGRGSYWKFIKQTPETVVTYTDLQASSNVIRLDVEKPFSLADESFDHVFAFNLFEHIKNHSKSAGEIYRVLKPGGTFFVVTPFLHEYHGDPDDFFRFTDSYLKAWLESEGFQCQDIEALGEGIFTWFACKAASLCLPSPLKSYGAALGYLGTTWLDRLARLRPRIDGRTIAQRFAAGFLGIFQKPPELIALPRAHHQ